MPIVLESESLNVLEPAGPFLGLGFLYLLLTVSEYFQLRQGEQNDSVKKVYILSPLNYTFYQYALPSIKPHIHKNNFEISLRKKIVTLLQW